MLVLACLVAGCAELPVVDDDIARARQGADSGRTLDLMRQQTERVARTQFIGGNAVELLRNGPETYAAMTAAITAAAQRIDMESYTFDTAEGGTFAELLLAKRAQGVEVNLIYDAWGSLGASPAMFARLRQGGVRVAITLAKSSIHLTTGFFVPPPDLRHALEGAARRGVDVRIIVPAHSTSRLAIYAGRADYEDMLEAGVHIYELQDVVLHAKTAVIDGAWSAVGSSNLDDRSVIFNNELDALILGSAFGKKLEAMFADDVAASREIDRADWARRPFKERLDEWWARLVEILL
jgi:phosphatidylserine/phosphatidylglycerophosphate/cardiolipin synthase-like enzyme